jgi:hypothetical protein
MALWLSHIAAHLQPIFKGRYYFGCKRAAIFHHVLLKIKKGLRFSEAL